MVSETYFYTIFNQFLVDNQANENYITFFDISASKDASLFYQ